MVMPFNELELGKREPVTEDEKQFVSVCRGEREPVTEAERVWIKYIGAYQATEAFPYSVRRQTADGKALTITPKAMTKKKGRKPFFYAIIFCRWLSIRSIAR